MATFCLRAFQYLNLVFFLGGCATWVHETEIPQVMAAKQLSIGATVGIVPAPQLPQQNYPAASSAKTLATEFQGVRYGFGSGFEATGDASVGPQAYSGSLRLRYQWLETKDSGCCISTVSFGAFASHYVNTLGGDAESYTIPNSQPADYITRYTTETSGISFSDSIGVQVLPSLTIYGGPKLYQISMKASYSHSTTDNLSYNGFIYGAFLGGAWTFKIHDRDAIVTDLMATALEAPPNFRGSSSNLVPGVSISTYYLF